MKLNFEERNSALWQKISEHAGQEIDRLRRKNDSALDDVTTANVRGRIAALKELLAVAEPQAEVTDE